MKLSVLKYQSIMFVVMIVIGMLFNPMNILAYKFSDLYISLTLFYSGLLMASNMMWAHELVHYFSMGKFNKIVFLIGIFLSISVSIFLLRKQLYVDEKQWLKRMISHHSTALTTSHKIHASTDSMKVKQLANEIINTQEREIKLMKSML